MRIGGKNARRKGKHLLFQCLEQHFPCFLNKGSHISVVHWVLQIVQLALPRSLPQQALD